MSADKKETQKPIYVKPEMKTVITPKENRDLDQPCAFRGLDKNRP